MMFRFLNSNVVKSVCMECSVASSRAGQLLWFGKSSSSFLQLVSKSAVARHLVVAFINFSRHYHKIFIQNLPMNATQKTVHDHFSQFGMVLSVYIVRDLETLKSKGRGYVVFAEKEAFYDALNSQPQTINNQELSFRPTKTLNFILKGLSPSNTSKSLQAYFSPYGRVIGSKVKGIYGFINFLVEISFDESSVSGVHWIDGTQVKVVRHFPKELTIRVGNLSPSTTDESLAAHFYQFGGVIQSDVKKDRITGKSRGFGFVCFASQQKLDNVLCSLPHVIDGREVKLRYATNEFDIFVCALPPNLTEDNLKQYFERFGPVYECVIERDKQTNEFLDYGRITFVSTEGMCIEWGILGSLIATAICSLLNLVFYIFNCKSVCLFHLKSLFPCLWHRRNQEADKQYPLPIVASISLKYEERVLLSLDIRSSNGVRMLCKAPQKQSVLEVHQPGLCGLQNIGKTCFLNSALQCLSSVFELTNYFLQGNYINEINDKDPLITENSLVHAYAELIKEMWSGTRSTVRPDNFKSAIAQRFHCFRGYEQHDSQELTIFLLDGLHKDLNRIKEVPYAKEKPSDEKSDVVVSREAWLDFKMKNDSIVVDLFYGQLKSTIVCSICKKTSVDFDSFNIVSVPIPSKERFGVSTIIYVGSEMWTKFEITHTSNVSVEKVLEKIKIKMQIYPQTKLMLVNSQGRIMEEYEFLACLQHTFALELYYVYSVNSGNSVVVENTFADEAISVPLIFNLSVSTISKKFVYDDIIPVVKKLLWCPKQSRSLILPMEIFISWKNKLFNLPKETTDEIDLPPSALKIVLKWATSTQFKSVNLENIVSRELNLTSSLKDSYTLYECFDLFTQEEQLSGADSWYCFTCERYVKAFKKLLLWSLPKILIIHLKRFEYRQNSVKKIDTPIIVPVKELDLKNFAGSSNEIFKYDLFAVNNHSGSLGSGHYTAKALNYGQWYEFNDSSAVVSTDLEEPFETIEGYMLYYRRRQTGTSEQFPNFSASCQNEVNSEANS